MVFFRQYLAGYAFDQACDLLYQGRCRIGREDHLKEGAVVINIIQKVLEDLSSRYLAIFQHDQTKIDQDLFFDLLIKIVDIQIVLIKGYTVDVCFVRDLTDCYLGKFFCKMY